MFPGKRFAQVLNTLLPRYCGLCGAAAEGRSLCPACFADLPRIRDACYRCGSPLDGPPAADLPCGLCQRSPPGFTRAFAPLHYRPPIDRVIHAYKFGGRLQLAPTLAAIVSPWFTANAGRFDALVPVPLHRWRHARRGFNQAAEIARQLFPAGGLQICRRVVRRRATKPQPGLDSIERRRNLRGAFAVRGRLESRHPLIIDDVMTSGATCDELARTLIDAGAETVGVLAIARA